MKIFILIHIRNKVMSGAGISYLIRSALKTTFLPILNFFKSGIKKIFTLFSQKELIACIKIALLSPPAIPHLRLAFKQFEIHYIDLGFLRIIQNTAGIKMKDTKQFQCFSSTLLKRDSFVTRTLLMDLYSEMFERFN